MILKLVSQNIKHLWMFKPDDIYVTTNNEYKKKTNYRLSHTNSLFKTGLKKVMRTS